MPATKVHILAEIRRTAAANSGVPLGWRRFEQATGIRYYDWNGRFWSKWGDAVREAGFEPQRLSEAYDDEHLLECLASLTRRLGRVPTVADLRLATRSDPEFPSEKVFRRLGSRTGRAARILAYCAERPGYEDVATIWAPAAVATKATVDNVDGRDRCNRRIHLPAQAWLAA